MGTWHPVSNVWAAYGQTQLAGVRAALHVANERGGVQGRKFTLIHEDDGLRNHLAEAAARKLISQDGVFALVSPNLLRWVESRLNDVFEEGGVPVVNPIGGEAAWFNPPKANLYGAQLPPETQARALGQWVGSEGHRKVLVVHFDLGAQWREAKALAEATARVAPSVNIEYLGVEYMGGRTFDSIGQEIAARKPDAVVFILNLVEVVEIAKSFQRQGFSVPTYTYGFPVFNPLFYLGGTAVEGLSAVSHALPPTHDNPALREYREALAKVAPSEVPDYTSLNAYFNTMVFVEAVRRIDGPITREALTRSLRSMKNYATGIQSPLTYGPNRHLGTTAMQRVRISGGQWVVAGEPIGVEP